jgi:soluble lytic murein transglycosylase
VIRAAATAVALVAGVICVAHGVGLRAQSSPSNPRSTGPAGPVIAAPGVTTTDHAPLPGHPSRYWVVPDSQTLRAQGATGNLAQFVRGARLIDAGNFAAGLPLVSPPLGPTPLAPYGRYYTGVALLGMGRAAEADVAFAGASRADGYLKEVLPLRMAESAMAQKDAKRAVAVLEQALREPKTARDEPLLLLGAAREAAGDRDGALAAYERVYYEFPLSDRAAEAEAAITRLRSPDVVVPDRLKRDLNRAEQLFTARRWASARAAFVAVLPGATGADRELAGLRIAECDHYLKNQKAAVTALKAYLRPGPFEAEARFFHLTATRALGDRPGYVTLARRLIADHPYSPWTEETLNNLASHFVGDDDEEADRVFRELATRFPRGRYAERAAWKIGWQSYKKGRFTETAVTFEAAAAAFPRADYRPSWLYWAARSREQLGNQAAASAIYRVVAADYLNSYYGRLASRTLLARGESPVRPIVGSGRIEAVGGPVVPNENVIKALASVDFHDAALREVDYARRMWGDSSALQATTAWIRNQRAIQGQTTDRFGDLRGAITLMRRAYPQFMAAGGEQLPDDVLRVIFPLDYWPLIKKYSDSYKFDPYLMTALIAQESTFTPDVRSSANAVGLMQLIPPTARRYATKLGIRYSSSILTQPETNIQLGMRYFKDLMDRFGGAHFALASYNAGENRIARWIAERPGFEQDEFIDDIPFPETQNYVKRILGTADDYRRLYGERALSVRSAQR